MVERSTHQEGVVRSDYIDVTAHEVLHRILQVDGPAKDLDAFIMKPSHKVGVDIRLLDGDVVRVGNVLDPTLRDEHTVPLRS